MALGDLSPALILLPEAERRRVQALATYVLTLYDFVRQTGLEGERLSRVNRWEFELDSALEGAPTGQPVFVALADQHRRRPWDTDGLDRLHGCARHRIAIPRPSTPEAARKDSLDLASALVSTLLGNPPTTDAVELVAAHLRLAGLRNLGEALRRHRPTLPVSELAETWHTAPALRREAVSEAVAREAVRLRVIFEATTSSFVALPGEYRGSARFLRSAGLRLVSEIDRRGGEVAESPPGLGAGARIWLLLKASMGRSF